MIKKIYLDMLGILQLYPLSIDVLKYILTSVYNEI